LSLIVVFFFFLQTACSNSFYILKLRMFLRDYVDKLYYRQKPDKRKRNRVHDNTEFVFNETAAPLNAPRWTKSGYNGTMLNLITEAVRNDEIDDFFLPITSKSQDMMQEFALVDITSAPASQSTAVQESTVVQGSVEENQEQQAETSENEKNKSI
jgi:hypothetical protein